LQEFDPMTKTVTSLFHSDQHAATAANRVAQAGIPRDAIDIWSTPHNLAPLLEDDGLSRADAYAYAEGVLRGGSVVIVKCDTKDVEHVVSILDQEGVLDLDEQQVFWRSEGWQGATGLESSPTEPSSPAQSRPAVGYDLTGSPDMTAARADMGAVDRPDEVGHGRVRIRSRSKEHRVQK
jgi:hypothetical protein